MSHLLTILKTGWGILLILCGALSLAVDTFRSFLTVTTDRGSSIPIFGYGSYTFGWIAVVLVSVIPAAIFRAFRKQPINHIAAGLWCGATLFVDLYVNALLRPDHTNISGVLLMIAATRVAWSLLTLSEDPPSTMKRETETRNSTIPMKTISLVSRKRSEEMMAVMNGRGVASHPSTPHPPQKKKRGIPHIGLTTVYMTLLLFIFLFPPRTAHERLPADPDTQISMGPSFLFFTPPLEAVYSSFSPPRLSESEFREYPEFYSSSINYFMWWSEAGFLSLVFFAYKLNMRSKQ